MEGPTHHCRQSVLEFAREHFALVALPTDKDPFDVFKRLGLIGFQTQAPQVRLSDRAFALLGYTLMAAYCTACTQPGNPTHCAQPEKQVYGTKPVGTPPDAYSISGFWFPGCVQYAVIR